MQESMFIRGGTICLQEVVQYSEENRKKRSEDKDYIIRFIAISDNDF